MDTRNIQIEYLELLKQGYEINTLCMQYPYAVESNSGYVTWKNKAILFTDRHLTDHPFYQQLKIVLNTKHDQTNQITDIINIMEVIRQDKEYWQQQANPKVNYSTWGIFQNQPAFGLNSYQMQQAMMPYASTQNMNMLNGGIQMQKPQNQKVFIVHGHDNEAKTEMARILEKLGFEAIILHEQPNAGRTIIEKIAAYSDVAFAVVLYTECDLGRDKNIPVDEEKYRARQNVVFEHGYLIGKLGREKVSAFVKGDVETPGDISGVVYTAMDKAGAWKQELVREMNAIGLNVDFNKLL